jgi:hypothetical protein
MRILPAIPALDSRKQNAGTVLKKVNSQAKLLMQWLLVCLVAMKGFWPLALGQRLRP